MAEDIPEFLGIYREKVFSPGKIQQDAAILEASLAALAGSGNIRPQTLLAAETLDGPSRKPAWVLSMAQSPLVLDILEEWEKQGARVVNSVQAVRNCYRKPLIRILQKAGLPIPSSRILPLEDVANCLSFPTGGSYWLKRGDVHAVQSADVVKVSCLEELRQALAHFREQQIDEILVQDHVEGEVIKFYGIGRGTYFVAFLTSTGVDITASVEPLSILARQAAEAIGLEIYGGDAVLTGAGETVLIDINDWPSFSRCCGPAAQSIANYITCLCRGGADELPGST